MENIIKRKVLLLFALVLLFVSCEPCGIYNPDDEYNGEFDVFELYDQTRHLYEPDVTFYIYAPNGKIITREATHNRGRHNSKFKLHAGLKDGEYRLLYAEYKLPNAKEGDQFQVGRFGLGMRIEVKDRKYTILDSYNSTYGLSGEGTEKSPFIITSASHLDTLRKITNTRSTDGIYFSQMTHILGDDMLYHGYKCDPQYYWTPIGFDVNNPFKGVYNGNGYYIQGVKSISSDMTIGRGLFGFVCGANIIDLEIVDSYIEGTYGTGSLVGIVVSDGGESDITQIFNCKVSSSEVYGKSGSLSLGGLVGAVDSKAILNISDCHSVKSRLKGDYNVGGVVGAGAVESIISINNCSNSSSVTVNHAGAGGIIANGDTLYISTSKNLADGKVTGPETQVSDVTAYVAYGGILGGARAATITACENNAQVTGYEGVGGIVGSTRVNYDDNGYIFNNVLLRYCKNTGAIKGVNNVGGLCGESQFGCYGSLNTGSVSGNDYVGGISGNTSMNVVENTLNNGAVSGRNYVAGITAKASTGIMAVCQNYGAVSATGNHAAGIAGYCEDYSMIHYCSNYGKITGSGTPIGGIVAELGKEQELSTLNKAEIAFGSLQIALGGILAPVFGTVELLTEKIAFAIVEIAMDGLLSLVEAGFLIHAADELLGHVVEEMSMEIQSIAEETVNRYSAEMESIRKSATFELNDLLSPAPLTSNYSDALISISNEIGNEEKNELMCHNMSEVLEERLEVVEEYAERSEMQYLIAGGILLVLDVVAISFSIATAGTSVAVVPMVAGATIACFGGANSIIKGATDWEDNIIAVTQCVNAGSISGGSGSKIGGIVGHLQQFGYVSDCLNSGKGPGGDRGGQIIGYAGQRAERYSCLGLEESGWKDIIDDEAGSSHGYPLEGMYYFGKDDKTYPKGVRLDETQLPKKETYKEWNMELWNIPDVSSKLSYPVPNKSEMLKE